MNRKILKLFIISIFLFLIYPIFSDDLTIPNSFSAGGVASAAEVNENFSSVENAVNDNDSRISTLESNNVGQNIDTTEIINGTITTDDIDINSFNSMYLPKNRCPGFVCNQNCMSLNYTDDMDWVEVGTVDIEHPESGFIIAFATCNCNANIDPGDTFYPVISLDNSSHINPSSQYSYSYNSSSSRIHKACSLNLIYTATVTGTGTDTFYLSSRKGESTSSNFRCDRCWLVAIYIPYYY